MALVNIAGNVTRKDPVLQEDELLHNNNIVSSKV